MTVREVFESELDELKAKLLDLGKLAQTAIDNSIVSLIEQDVDKALKIIDEDPIINSLEKEINDKAVWLIAKEQPLATDLRRLIATLKITTDLERIGDLAVNIAMSVIEISNKPLIKPIEEIPKMAAIAQHMIDNVLKAFYEGDIFKAKEVADIDDKVDEMYGRLINELMGIMTQKPDYITQITHLAFICRYIERVADHATNISESTIYLVKGKTLDLNK